MRHNMEVTFKLNLNSYHVDGIAKESWGHLIWICFGEFLLRSIHILHVADINHHAQYQTCEKVKV